MTTSEYKPLRREHEIVIKSLEKMTEQHHPVFRLDTFLKTSDVYEAICHYEQRVEEIVKNVDPKKELYAAFALNEVLINIKTSFGTEYLNYKKYRDWKKYDSDLNG